MPNNYIEPNTSISGDKIIAEARRIDPIRVINKTGRHKAQTTTLRDNAYCVIDRPLKIHESKFNTQKKV